jgi:hypothetical protein
MRRSLAREKDVRRAAVAQFLPDCSKAHEFEDGVHGFSQVVDSIVKMACRNL